VKALHHHHHHLAGKLKRGRKRDGESVCDIERMCANESKKPLAGGVGSSVSFQTPLPLSPCLCL